jgi:hypothetical protein
MFVCGIRRDTDPTPDSRVPPGPPSRPDPAGGLRVRTKPPRRTIGGKDWGYRLRPSYAGLGRSKGTCRAPVVRWRHCSWIPKRPSQRICMTAFLYTLHACAGAVWVGIEDAAGMSAGYSRRSLPFPKCRGHQHRALRILHSAFATAQFMKNGLMGVAMGS